MACPRRCCMAYLRCDWARRPLRFPISAWGTGGGNCCLTLAIPQPAPHFYLDPEFSWDFPWFRDVRIVLNEDRDVIGMAISKWRGGCHPSVRAYTYVNVVASRSGCVRPCCIVTTGEPA